MTEEETHEERIEKTQNIRSDMLGGQEKDQSRVYNPTPWPKCDGESPREGEADLYLHVVVDVPRPPPTRTTPAPVKAAPHHLDPASTYLKASTVTRGRRFLRELLPK